MKTSNVNIRNMPVIELFTGDMVVDYKNGVNRLRVTKVSVIKDRLCVQYEYGQRTISYDRNYLVKVVNL